MASSHYTRNSGNSGANVLPYKTGHRINPGGDSERNGAEKFEIKLNGYPGIVIWLVAEDLRCDSAVIFLIAGFRGRTAS